ncbi:acyl-CoA dehydrogenase family protein [Duganella sp. Dugasp56]|uniref:acyl-CoA dehydrogenase family protein n=1 Tax=Duganella sp. Dugasp56 TaxID=3243046 RepID=UPI0039AEF7BB
MNIDFETANMLDDSVRRYAEDKYSFLDRHRVLTQPAGYSEAAWRDYAAFGWLALRLPEDAGGLDADVFAVAALMETVGARLLMEPVLASAIVGTELLRRLGSDAQRAELLPRLADGSLKLAYAHGAPLRVSDGRVSGAAEAILHGDIADLILVSAVDDAAGAAPQVYLVDPAATGVSRTAFRLVDDRGAANMRFDQARALRLAGGGEDAAEVIADALDLATVAQCAEALGIVRKLVDTTVDYLKVRSQFGKPIGTNQALQHRAVDMFFLSQEIAALTVDAKHAMALPAAGRAGRISGAKAYIVQAARKVANEAVQMHGGLGLTEELDVSHYFRRLMVGAALFGDREQQFARFLSVS